jgi:hypothetical protein
LLDQAVGFVGFGNEKVSPYWFVRNSWDVHWHENGYIRMIRGKKNQCGVALMLFFQLFKFIKSKNILFY